MRGFCFTRLILRLGLLSRRFRMFRMHNLTFSPSAFSPLHPLSPTFVYSLLPVCPHSPSRRLRNVFSKAQTLMIPMSL